MSCNDKQTQTNDWFEFALDYYCGINGKKVAGYVEHEWEMPLVPDWCPCLVK